MPWRPPVVVALCVLLALQPCAAQSPDPDAAPAECVEIARIEVTGVSLLSTSTVRRIARPYEGRCLGLDELDEVLEALTLIYVEAGYVSTRAYLPEQDLSGGTLSILVVEGVLEAIVTNGAAGEYRGQLDTAFPGLVGRPLNLREIEQGLEQINRLGSNQTTIELLPGQELGGTVLAVSNEAGRRWRATVAVDNLGASSSGERRVRVSGSYDDLLGINDRWEGSYQRSTEGAPWSFTDEGRHSDTWTAEVSLPSGYWTVAAEGVRSRSWTPVPGQFGEIETSASSTTAKLTVSRVVHRDAESKTTAAGTVTWQATETKVLGVRVEALSAAGAKGALRLTHERQVGGGLGTATVAVRHGPLALRPSARERYTVLTGSMGWERSFAVGALSARYTGAVTGQWSNDDLRVSEQQSLGGAGSVRGVREEVVSGNRAGVVRTDLALRLPGDDVGGGVWLELYGGLDAGGVLTQPERGITGGGVVGATAGVRLGTEWLAIDLSYGELLAASDGLLDEGELPAGMIAARATVSL